MKPGWLLAYGVFIGLLVGGGLYLVSRPPRGEPIRLLPPPTPAPLLVHVAGQVHNPGVVSLPPGSRVQDAIKAAGGLTEEADQTALNLAARLVDGQKVLVPARSGSSPGVDVNSAMPQSSGYPIDLNTADQHALESLPGIGPSTAQAIIRYREQHGPFRTLQDLDAVSGIGPETIKKIEDLVSVNP